MVRQLLFLLLALGPAAASRLAAQGMDTVMLVRLKEVEIRDSRKWDNDTIQYYFNQTRYYVQTILPYLEAATAVFEEVNRKLEEPGLSRKERKRFVHAREEELRLRFEDKVRSLNETQGLLLIKLIARQTGVNIYNVLREFRNPLTAVKWQTWARLNGFNLNKRYDPAEEVLLEQVMLSLGYDLPEFYGQQGTATAMKPR